MTAATVVSKGDYRTTHFVLTIVTESDEFEIEDPAFVLSYSADAHSIASISLPI